MPDDDVTTGEVMRALTTFREDVREDFTNIRKQIDTLHFVSGEVYQADHYDHERRLNTIESGIWWAVRVVLTLVLTAVVGGVLIA